MKFKCKHCGHVHEGEKSALKFCPSCGKTWEPVDVEEPKTPDADGKVANKDLIGQVKEVVTDAVKGIRDGVKTLNDKHDALEKRVGKIEDLPAKGGPAINRHSSTEKYSGYKISKMGMSGQGLLFKGRSLKSHVMKNKHEFEVLADEEKFEEFSKFMIDVKDAMLGDIEAQQKLQTAQKASELVEGTDSLGGYTVPDEFQSDLIKLAKEKSFALQDCTVMEMNHQTMPIPTELTRVSVNWPSEAAAPTESNSTFGQVELTAKKLAGLTDGISRELLSDSAIDIVGLLTEQFMYAIGLELDNQVLNGTGSPCSGVLTAAAGNSVVMSGANFSSIGADDLSEMIYNLAEEDAAMAKFVYNRLVQHYIRTLKDDNNQYIWQKPGEGRTGTIWELPYFQSSKAPGTSATSTAFVALGNWKKFFIGRRVGQMSLEMDPYSEFAKDLVRFKMVTRWGMAMARASAFCRLVTGS